MIRRISEVVQLESYTGSGEDAHGNETESWAAPTDIGIYAFNPGSSSEPALPGQERVITTPTLYVPSDRILGPRDRVTVRGKVFEVDGDTLDFRNPFASRMDGNVVNLKAVSG